MSAHHADDPPSDPVPAEGAPPPLLTLGGLGISLQVHRRLTWSPFYEPPVDTSTTADTSGDDPPPASTPAAD
jgi:hypothetical protein